MHRDLWANKNTETNQYNIGEMISSHSCTDTTPGHSAAQSDVHCMYDDRFIDVTLWVNLGVNVLWMSPSLTCVDISDQCTVTSCQPRSQVSICFEGGISLYTKWNGPTPPQEETFIGFKTSILADVPSKLAKFYLVYYKLSENSTTRTRKILLQPQN